MTEQTTVSDPAKPVTPAVPDPAVREPAKVDLESEVASAAKKAEREAQKRASLDLIDNPEHRKIAERLVSQGVNDYRKSLEDGKNEDFVRKADVEKAMRDFAKTMKAEQAAVEQFRDHMADLGIKRGSEDWSKFEAEVASGFYDKSKLGDRKLVERIAQAAQVGQFRPRQEIPAGGIPFIPAGGVALHVDKDGKTKLTGDPEMDAVMADYNRSMRQRGGQTI